LPPRRRRETGTPRARADQEGDRDANPDLDRGVLQPGQESVQPQVSADAAEGHADRGNDGAEGPERDHVTGRSSLGRGKEQREQRDRPELPGGRTRDRQPAEDGSQMTGVGEDGDDEPERRGGQCDGEKERLRTHPTAWKAAPATDPSSSEPAKAASGARS
jgi:hypothetical protein